jgi:hypothetical protein
VDGTGTGTRDFVVFLLVDARTDRRALVVHEWGSAPEAFGKAVFYVILEPDGEVVEWAGTHRLPSPRTPPEGAPAPPRP